jgi:hypothetical protein
MDGQERGAGCFGGEADLFEVASGGVEFVGVDPFAGAAGVGADVNGEFLWCGCDHVKSECCEWGDLCGRAEKFLESHGGIKQGRRAAGNSRNVPRVGHCFTSNLFGKEAIF